MLNIGDIIFQLFSISIIALALFGIFYFSRNYISRKKQTKEMTNRIEELEKKVDSIMYEKENRQVE